MFRTNPYQYVAKLPNEARKNAYFKMSLGSICEEAVECRETFAHSPQTILAECGVLDAFRNTDSDYYP